MRSRHRLASGEFAVDHRPRSDGDEGHGDHSDRLHDDDSTVRTVEHGAADEAVGLSDAADHGDHQRGSGDLGVVTGRLDQVGRTGAGEHDSSDEHRPAEPDADRGDVDEVDHDAEGDKITFEAGEGHGRGRGGRKGDGERLRAGFVDPLGVDGDPEAAGHEHETRYCGSTRPSRLEEVHPRERAECGAEGVGCEVRGERCYVQHRAYESNRPCRDHEALRDGVEGSFRPHQGDHRRRSEENEHGDTRDEPAEPYGAAGGSSRPDGVGLCG